MLGFFKLAGRLLSFMIFAVIRCQSSPLHFKFNHVIGVWSGWFFFFRDIFFLFYFAVINTLGLSDGCP
jgi:hypothetical protein